MNDEKGDRVSSHPTPATVVAVTRNDGRLSFPQRRALGNLLRATCARSPESIFTRRDVLWRLEERGLVTRNLHDQWRITSDGVLAYERHMEALDG